MAGALRGLVAALLIVTAGMADAVAGSPTGDYVGMRGIGAYSFIDGVTQNSAGALQIRNDDDEVGALGLVLGYDWAGKGMPLRSELEYHYRARFDFDTRITGGTNAGFENQLSTHAVLFNLYYDFFKSWRYKPYVGAGFGWVRNVSDVDRVPLTGGAKEERTDSKDNFSWSVMMGLMFKLSESWRFEFGYRYIDLGEVESGAFQDGAVITAEDYTSHDIILGFLYRF